MQRILALLGLVLALATPALAADPIRILAAEDFYGEVARAVGGDRVAVESVLLGPDIDPHDYEPTPSIARNVSDARVVIFNGAGYDHWIEHLVEASGRPERRIIEVAALIGAKEGDNPHIWYEPRTMPALAAAIAATLAVIDPDRAADYAARRDSYVASLAAVGGKVAAMKERFAGQRVAATEPVFGYMAEALGLVLGNNDFQTAIMNETEPSPRALAAMLDAIRGNTVRVLIYNTQVTDAITEQLLAAAKQANVPVVGVTETMPAGMTYAAWMTGQLGALEKALTGPSS
jgi:zinc/manganese transport system substrate-binding protein